MPWRITYWRGSTRVREMTIEEGIESEIAAKLEQLAIQHVDLDTSEAAEHATSFDEDAVKVRSNRSGSMLWTTGREFHYTAELYLRGPRKRQPS